jgi:hypothetical protein
MHFAPQHSFKPTDEPETVSVEKAALICLIISLSAWVGVYLLFRSVVEGE